MRPDYHQAIIDTIQYYGWQSIIYLYDSHDGEYEIVGELEWAWQAHSQRTLHYPIVYCMYFDFISFSLSLALNKWGANGGERLQLVAVIVFVIAFVFSSSSFSVIV